MIPPIVVTLLANGLGILGNAVLAKGKEVIEEKTGIKLPDGDQPLTAAQVADLKRAEMQHEEFLITAGIERQRLDLEAEKAAQGAVTARWQADMVSDSWLSKNIRPGSLIYLLLAVTLFAILDAVGIKISDAYINLFAELLKLAFGAYFVGRTVVQGIEMVQQHKTMREGKL